MIFCLPGGGQKTISALSLAREKAIETIWYAVWQPAAFFCIFFQKSIVILFIMGYIFIDER
jgi:hypothetical protein